jgi:hypothetical protein
VREVLRAGTGGFGDVTHRDFFVYPIFFDERFFALIIDEITRMKLAQPLPESFNPQATPY